MSETLREAMRAVAVKLEATSGADIFAGTPATADYIGGSFTFAISQDTADNPEENGSLDDSPPIPTGLRGQVEIRIPLRGSGAPATAPEWGRLLQCCGWKETITAAALGAPTALTVGTANTATLGTPFAATAQAYRGMPLLLSGTPASGLALITDYTAGKVATLTDTFSPALTTTALAQVPANVLYSPTSDEAAFKSATIYLYEDGLRHRLVGCVGSWRLDMAPGKPGYLIFTLRGQVLDAHQPVALPTGWNTITRQPLPIWIGGKCQLNRITARTDAFRYDAAVALQDIENPEAPQGYDAPIMARRSGRAELAPYATTTASPARFSAMTAGSSIPFGAVIGATAGNRISITLPSSRITQFDRSKRGELGVDQIVMRPDLPDAAAFLCSF